MLKPRDRETLRKYLLSQQKSKKLTPQLIDFLAQNYSDCVFINDVRVSTSIQQKLNLKSKIIADFGSNFMQPVDSNADRIATAEIHNNEKDAKVNPDQNYLNVVQQSGVINAAELTTSLPKGVSVRVNIEHLNTHRIENIIVVENLVVFDQWYLASLPIQLCSAFTVYRGHDKTAKAVVQFLKNSVNKANIIAFMDFDPKGLNMALTLPNVTHILVPDPAYVKSDMSQARLYIKQADYLGQLKHNPKWNQYSFVQHLLLNNLAITQEMMLARNVPLILVKL